MENYGSIHTHFESRFDTANNLSSMCEEFVKLGFKKVAVTEHGVFSSYEDLKKIVKEKVLDLEIIPGVEGYFLETLPNPAPQMQLKENATGSVNEAEEEESENEFFGKGKHIVLVAKDYEGYLSLSKIITESNRNIVGGNPIITLDNLQKNVAKGHLICTSACIGGIFGGYMGLEEYNLKQKKEKIDAEIAESHYYEIKKLDDEFLSLKKVAERSLLQKRRNAEKALQKHRNYTAMQNYLLLEAEQKEAIDTIESRKLEFVENHKRLGELNRRRFGSKITMLEEINQRLTSFPSPEKQFQKAKTLYNKLTKIFGKKDFYLEIQNHGLEPEKIVYPAIVDFAKFVGHDRFIASNDIHIGISSRNIDRLPAELERRNVVQFTRFNKYSPIKDDEKEYYIKTNDELEAELLKIIPDKEIVDNAIKNIETALSDCEIIFPQKNHYPAFCDDEPAEFDRLIKEGIKKRFPKGFPSPEYEKRLQEEIEVISSMGYIGYHLIVADYLEYGRLVGYLPDEYIQNAPLTKEGVKELLNKLNVEPIGYNIGPGRGSGAGSLVCYLFGITDIDPIPYDLLFERFLNKERVSMPDIDSDFRTDVREKVVEYCKEKYGSDCICQIMTKGYGSIKGNLRIAARYLGSKAFEEDQEMQRLKNIVTTSPEDVRSDINTASASEKIDSFLKPWYNIADKLSKSVENDRVIGKNFTDTEQKIINLAKELDGVFLNYGQHAAGTIISDTPLENVLPLMWNPKKKNFETQCIMEFAEAMGLLKMDFLGLKNLNIITKIMRLTKDARLQDIEQRLELLAMPQIYSSIFATGLTHGVFQFESPGMKKMLQQFKPESFEDIILLVAAYRPGPMDYIPEIIAQKWYNKFDGDYKKYSAFIRNIYPFDKDNKRNSNNQFYDVFGNVQKTPPHSITVKCEPLQKILAPTYSCPIYQEQIMQIFQKMAGYSLGGADIVRRYMSKKKEDKLAKEKKTFVFGDEKRNIPGCIKLHGLTQEEAEMLFEQMMPFAKYGFNKSHATAYALVAFFTAFLKYEHPAEFYTESLNAIQKLDELPPFVDEMHEFNVHLLGPSVLKSKNRFSCDGNNIYFGLKYIKGQSENEFTIGSSVEDFCHSNIHLGIKTLEHLIAVGVLDCFDYNRTKVAKWFDANSSKIKSLHDTKIAFDSVTEEDIAENPKLKTKQIQRIQTISELEDSIDKLYDYNDIPLNIKENRANELELLGYVFSIKDSERLINLHPDKTDFSALQTRDARVNAIVLSCGPLVKSKSGKSQYHSVRLKDRTGAEIVRRFDSPVHETEGSFMLTSEDGKFFLNKTKDIRPLKIKEYIAEELTEEHINSLAAVTGNVVIKSGDTIEFFSTEEKITSCNISGYYTY